MPGRPAVAGRPRGHRSGDPREPLIRTVVERLVDVLLVVPRRSAADADERVPTHHHDVRRPATGNASRRPRPGAGRPPARAARPTARPRTSTRPENGRSRPAMTLSRVLLPAPFGPDHGQQRARLGRRRLTRRSGRRGRRSRRETSLAAGRVAAAIGAAVDGGSHRSASAICSMFRAHHAQVGVGGRLARGHRCTGW